MTDATVIAFPGHAPSSAPSSPAEAYRDWLSWAECEFSILGHDIAASGFDWEAAYRDGLRPEAAAAQAAAQVEAG
ncbi:hypothetical protein [Pelagibius sp.]|uniref:hypothetical protein n=1 Tax=Pelagibius sp. TaxID=1931238 RepID=UPI003B50714A